ncbi:MAG TPA: FkbM family methyltransferase [Xanthobacteraceae bacterium]|nr:FkbM family methyltransferase [Xanthobacteraceae bacterium]
MHQPQVNIECPPSMLAHIREIFGGEYDVPYSRYAPVILDIGANIGGFAIWASRRWPGSVVHCYEPVPSNFELLRKNLSHFDPNRFQANNFAIGNPSRTTMYLGKNNCGEASFFDIGEQTTDAIDVATLDPQLLPNAQILKLDVEGSEIEILERHSSINYEVILVEYHGESARRRLDAILNDYCLVAGKVRCLHRGVFKYMHRKIVTDYARYEAP